MEGACVDLPSEPKERLLKEKVKHTVYPVVEAGGALWAYLGPRQLHASFSLAYKEQGLPSGKRGWSRGERVQGG